MFWLERSAFRLCVCSLSTCLSQDYGHAPLPVVVKSGINVGTWYKGGATYILKRIFPLLFQNDYFLCVSSAVTVKRRDRLIKFGVDVLGTKAVRCILCKALFTSLPFQNGGRFVVLFRSYVRWAFSSKMNASHFN